MSPSHGLRTLGSRIRVRRNTSTSARNRWRGRSAGGSGAPPRRARESAPPRSAARIEGYCFLTATTSNFSTTGPWPSTLPGQLHGPTTEVSGDPVQAEQDLEPSRRRVHVVITPAPDPQVTVSIDFNDGNGSQQVLQTAAPDPVPATYKFGLAASTGLFTDTHLIRKKQVRQPLPRDHGRYAGAVRLRRH